MTPDEQSSAAAREGPGGGAPLDEGDAAGEEATGRQAATGNARTPGIIELVAGVTGVAQERLLRFVTTSSLVARQRATVCSAARSSRSFPTRRSDSTSSSIGSRSSKRASRSRAPRAARSALPSVTATGRPVSRRPARCPTSRTSRPPDESMTARSMGGWGGLCNVTGPPAPNVPARARRNGYGRDGVGDAAVVAGAPPAPPFIASYSASGRDKAGASAKRTTATSADGRGRFHQWLPAGCLVAICMTTRRSSPPRRQGTPATVGGQQSTARALARG